MNTVSEEKEPSVRQRLKSYEETCVELGRLLANNDDRSRHTVIYIVNPGPHMSSYLDMCRCFYKLKEACENASHQEQKARLVLQLIPIDHILRTSAFGGYTLMGMKDTAFSVYSKCFSIITRKV
jgi:hypothetical protein